MTNAEEWPEITAVEFKTVEDAQSMAVILNDMMLKITTLRDALLELRKEVRAIPPKNWDDLGPMG